jgi:glyoxalase family protein
MKLDGIHHVTAITADAQGAIDFHVGVLGLRLVKTTVNFDAPDLYHLYMGDETGSPGSVLTFFEVRGAPTGRPGAGMIHRIVWRVPSRESLDFWADRLGGAGRPVERSGDALVGSDPEGLGIELVVSGDADGAPREAWSPDIPAEHALGGIVGVRAHSASPGDTRRLLTDDLGFTRHGGGHLVTAGARRRGVYVVDPAPEGRPVQGAGTVHHVAWTAPDAEHSDWIARIRAAGGHPTGVIDRQYFFSIYFHEPGGVLFEIASPSPGFAVDEAPGHLGEALRLPPQYERHRDRIEERLTPLDNPRTRLAPPSATSQENR